MSEKMLTETIVLEGKLSEVCTQKVIRTNFIIIGMLCALSFFGYFFCAFNIGKLDGDLRTNSITPQISELIAVLLSGFFYQVFGPKKAFSSMFFISLLGAIGLAVTKLINMSKFDLFLLPIAKFGVSANVNLVFVASMQLIPTVFVPTLFGYTMCLGRIFAFAGSYIS
jgi:hypothetical protein